MSAPWLEALEDARNCGVMGGVLTFNTADRVQLAEPGLEVASLRFSLAHHFARCGYHVGYYATGSGFEILLPPGTEDRCLGRSPFGGVPNASDPLMVLSALGGVLRTPEPPALVILDYADHLAPQASGGTSSLRREQLRTLQILHGWSLDDDIRATRNFVVLVSPENEVNSLLTEAGGYRRIPIDLPGEEQRLEFCGYLSSVRAAGGEDMVGRLGDGLDLDQFARETGGLRLLDIEELFRHSAATGDPVEREAIVERKRAAIAQLGQELLEVIEPEGGFETVAGAAHARAYFELIREPWHSGAASVPQGILLAGVPGCGKSHIVRALASELRAPLLALRSIREAWVGQSERNLERVLWLLDNLSPCILWTDEIDQVIGRSAGGPSGDSGTSERIVGRILEFFGTMRHRGRILWIATTNRPDVIDPALLDRFQVIIPFIHPTRAERAELLPVLAGQIERRLGDDVEPAEMAGLPQLAALTVRSLEEIVALAGLRSDHDGRCIGGPIDRDHLLAAARDFKPAYDPVEHEFIALTALRMASFSSLLPWSGREGPREGAEWPVYLDGLVDAGSGSLDGERLSARLRELQGLRHVRRMAR